MLASISRSREVSHDFRANTIELNRKSLTHTFSLLCAWTWINEDVEIFLRPALFAMVAQSAISVCSTVCVVKWLVLVRIETWRFLSSLHSVVFDCLRLRQSIPSDKEKRTTKLPQSATSHNSYSPIVPVDKTSYNVAWSFPKQWEFLKKRQNFAKKRMSKRCVNKQLTSTSSAYIFNEKSDFPLRLSPRNQTTSWCDSDSLRGASCAKYVDVGFIKCFCSRKSVLVCTGTFDVPFLHCRFLRSEIWCEILWAEPFCSDTFAVLHGKGEPPPKSENQLQNKMVASPLFQQHRITGQKTWTRMLRIKSVWSIQTFAVHKHLQVQGGGGCPTVGKNARKDKLLLQTIFKTQGGPPPPPV